MAPLPTISKLRAAARRLVHQAKRTNTLGELTPRIVRERLTEQFSLDENDLETKEIKKALQAATRHAAEEDTEPESDDGASRLRKKPLVNGAAAKKRKSTADDLSDDVPSKKLVKVEVFVKQASPITIDDSDHAASSSSRREPEPQVDKSDSEMSALIDATPVKKGASGKKDRSSKSTSGKSTRTKKEKPELTTDEEEIKKLKSYVVACGVRKQWTKELGGLTPPQQIKRLKNILTGLGMTGRLSLEKAKGIRAQREFQQELEAVREFDGKINRTRPKRGEAPAPAKTGRRAELDTESESESDSESESEVKARGKNASQSIAAFLGDDDSD